MKLERNVNKCENKKERFLSTFMEVNLKSMMTMMKTAVVMKVVVVM